MLSPKQKVIVKYLQSHETIDFDTVRSLIDDHYRNGAKHCSEAMSRMVERGIVVRVKKGIYKLGNPKSNASKESVDINQTNIFESNT